MLKLPIKLPINGEWQQSNTSDRLGSLWATKNVTIENGNVKLSPRAVLLLDEAANSDLANSAAIGRFGSGLFQVATINANFTLSITSTTLDVTEDSGTNEPTTTADSHGVFWINRWHVSDADEVWSKDANGAANAAWTQRITGLTSGANHYLEVFDSRNTICVANANVVKQYNTSYAASIDLTIPTDYEVVGLAYNYGNMGVITQSSLGSTGHITEAKFYLWGGATTSATGYGVGASKCLAVAPYQSSFVMLTNKGKLLYFNGGGFTPLAELPFFSENKWIGDSVQTGNCMAVEGDRVFINIGTFLKIYGTDEQQQILNFPAGVWCFDPAVGLYHRYSGSLSQVYLGSISASGADIATDIATVASGTIPATGGLVRLINGAIGGITKNKPYYIIKLSSTTFAFADTREKALSGVKTDISTTNSGTVYVHFYDIVDYGVTYREDIAAVGLFGETSNLFTDVIFGGDTYTHAALASNDSLFMCVPDIEARGWIITPRIYASAVTETFSKLYVKFRTLKDSDSIVVKVKDRDVLGLPISAPSTAATGSDELIFTGTSEAYTGANLDGAMDYLNAGGELEIEFTAGVGAGQCVKITSIGYSSGTYTLAFAEDIVGATASEEAFFIINNWRVLSTITSEDNNRGYCDINVEATNKKFVQFKIELRGSGVTLEELVLSNKGAVIT